MTNRIVVSIASGFVLTMLFGPANAAKTCGIGAKVKDLCVCTVLELRPTQMTVGMIEVKDREGNLGSKKPSKRDAYLEKNPEPAVKGPGGALFITDHHHLARAEAELGIGSTYCTIQADYSSLDPDHFWEEMKRQNWVYPYDEKGEGPHDPKTDLPTNVKGLKDDPYRSLAGAVRRNGGYDKVSTPFAEFEWAKFFRTRIPIDLINTKFQEAVRIATEKAKTSEACALPGYHGPRCQ
jgi:hypothetical protein